MDPLWASLLNSDWHDHRGTGAREDRLLNDAWLGSFLARTGWTTPRLPDPGEREALRQLRALVRVAVDAYRVLGIVDSERLRALNKVLADAPVFRTLEASGRLTLVPLGGDMRYVLAEIVASLAAVLARGEPARVKICANPDCGWVIYDESRNLSRRWCDATECGNLLKVRRHRQRKKQENPGGAS